MNDIIMKMMNVQHKLADDEICANAFSSYSLIYAEKLFFTNNYQGIQALQYQIK